MFPSLTTYVVSLTLISWSGAVHTYLWLAFFFLCCVHGWSKNNQISHTPSSTEESGKCLKMLQFPNSAVGFSSKYFGALELRVCVCLCVCVCVSKRVLSVFCPDMWTPQIINASILIVLRDDGMKLAFNNTAKSNRSEKGKKNPFLSINCPSQCCSKVKYHHSLDVWSPPVKRD